MTEGVPAAQLAVSQTSRTGSRKSLLRAPWRLIPVVRADPALDLTPGIPHDDLCHQDTLVRHGLPIRDPHAGLITRTRFGESAFESDRVRKRRGLSCRGIDRQDGYRIAEILLWAGPAVFPLLRFCADDHLGVCVAAFTDVDQKPGSLLAYAGPIVPSLP